MPRMETDPELIGTKKRMLLTGFEPFEAFPINPTEEVIKIISSEEKACEDYSLDLRVLPVTHESSEIVHALLPENYDFVIHLGLHAKISDFAIERVAINIDDYRIYGEKT